MEKRKWKIRKEVDYNQFEKPKWASKFFLICFFFKLNVLFRSNMCCESLKILTLWHHKRCWLNDFSDGWCSKQSWSEQAWFGSGQSEKGRQNNLNDENVWWKKQRTEKNFFRRLEFCFYKIIFQLNDKKNTLKKRKEIEIVRTGYKI